MSAILLRKLNQEKILANPFTLSGNLYPVIGNGYGSFIRQPGALPVIKTYTNPVRISTEKSAIKRTLDNGTPYITEQRVYYMISDYLTLVDIGLEFVYNDINLRVKKIRELIKYGQLIGYEYELEEIGATIGT